MKLNLSNACDAERLEAFLSGDLSDVQEREFVLHLNECESCRRALAEQAAEPEAWREAELLLKPTRFDTGEPEPTSRQPLQIQYVLDALGPTDDPEKLGRLGGYEVSGVVGAGGMGVVLKAFDKSLDRPVAIKVLAPHLATSGAARKRFAREAKAAAAVLHPNVIAIHSVSNDEALPYLVMPYVRGASLQKRLDHEGPLPLQEILRIGAQIAAGLAAAHGQGLVHRDIKPANILLEEGVERVTITDFGLARAVDDATITHSGVIAGTPQFMSPEQARGEPVDARSDLFSLGSVLYAISTGRPPFRAETSYGVMRRITDDEPTPIRAVNPEIPDWLCRIIGTLMAKRAANRFESAAEVAALLEACLAHVQHPASAPLPPSLIAQPARRKFLTRPGVIAMLAALGLSLLGVFAWQATAPPNIAGKWSGPEWGEVVLAETDPGAYEGTYTDTFRKQPGMIEVRWSRLEGRYKGTWREGKDRSGKISLRLIDEEIRGAWTTSKKSEINPGTPELADLRWTRTPVAGADFQYEFFGPTLERKVRNREAIDFDTGNRAMIPDADLDPEKGLLWVMEQRLPALTQWMADEKMDAVSEGSSLTTFGLKVNELANSDWETIDTRRLRLALQVDWQKENPREFARAIDPVDPKAPPHAILALRTRPRTIAFQTREGKRGVLQLVEFSDTGFTIRFKLAQREPTAQGPGAPRAENAQPLILPPGAKLQFSEPKEVVLSMDGMKFMLDFDTGKTMDPPATIRPEQKLMDVYTDQVQPYHYPKELIGQGLKGLEVKASDWDASADDVRRALAGKDVTPLTRMDLGPEKHPTYFFQTRDGAVGVLQLLEIVDDPKGIRLRYKTLQTPAPAAPTPIQMRIAAPEKMQVAIADDRGEFANSPRLEVPFRLTVAPGKTYRLKLSAIPGRPGLELYPLLIVSAADPATAEFLRTGAIPLQFTAEDFDVAIASASPVVKVIYLSTNDETGEVLLSARGPLPERVLCKVRLGNIDLEADKNAVTPEKVKEDFLRRAGDSAAAEKLYDRIQADAHLRSVLLEATQFPERRGVLYAAELWRVWREAASLKAKEGGVPAPAAAVCFYLGCDPASADALRVYPTPPDATEGFRTHETLILSTAVNLELADAERKEPFNRLIAGWTAVRADPWTRALAIGTAREHRLTAMVPVVRQMAVDAKVEGRFRALAITLLAQLGGRDERPLLQQLLDHGGECYSRKLTIKGEDAPTATAEIRDIALGSLLLLDGFDLHTAGFDELNYLHPQPLQPHEYFRLAPFGFFTAEQRNATHAKFAALHVLPERPVNPNAGAPSRSGSRE